jgi:radial spoke head protein 4A
LKSETDDQSLQWATKYTTLVNPPPPPKKKKVKLDVDDDEDQIDEEEEEQPEEEEEDVENLDPYDMHHDFVMLNSAGIGLTDFEIQSLIVSMHRLKENDKKTTKCIQKIRFFGKILGLNANYYILEVEEEVKEPDEEAKEDDEQQNGDEDEKEPLDPKIVDLFSLGSNRKNIKKLLAEMNPVIPPEKRDPEKPLIQYGCNRYVYYVTTSRTFPSTVTDWIKLPDVEPSHIQQARQVKKHFTGDLDAPIISHPPFHGNEKILLRAQIARISAATKIAPKGVVVFEEDPEEEEELDEEGEPIKKTDHLVKPYVDIPVTKKNDELDPKKVDITVPENWVHIEPMILHTQGRQLLYQREDGEEEEEEEEEEENQEENLENKKPIEKIPPLFTSITLDEFQATDAGYRSWVIRRSLPLLLSYHPLASTTVSVRSVRWPGAMAVAENIPETGIRFANVYIGNGMKAYSGPSYTPFSPVFVQPVQKEYQLDPAVVEQIDAYEEKYKPVDKKKKNVSESQEVETPRKPTLEEQIAKRKEQLAVLNLKKTTVLMRETRDVQDPELMVQYKEPDPPKEDEEDAGDDEDY